MDLMVAEATEDLEAKVAVLVQEEGVVVLALEVMVVVPVQEEGVEREALEVLAAPLPNTRSRLKWYHIRRVTRMGTQSTHHLYYKPLLQQKRLQ